VQQSHRGIPKKRHKILDLEHRISCDDVDLSLPLVAHIAMAVEIAVDHLVKGKWSSTKVKLLCAAVCDGWVGVFVTYVKGISAVTKKRIKEIYTCRSCNRQLMKLEVQPAMY